MIKNKSKPLPKFDSLAQLVEFFETNDLGDYMDAMPEAHFDVDLKRKVHIIALDMEYQTYLNLLPKVKASPQQTMWVSYDADADTLYVNFKKPSHATDSELTDDDVIVRYEGNAVVGYTILHASKR